MVVYALRETEKKLKIEPDQHVKCVFLLIFSEKYTLNDPLPLPRKGALANTVALLMNFEHPPS